jgi:protein-S-isoprenylcysteine O-methyltransferase Ste14
VSHTLLILPRIVIPGAWAIWGAWWAIASVRAKPTVRHESALSQASHVVPLGLATALLLPTWHAGVLDRRWLAPLPLVVGCATLLVVAGLGLAIWARVHLAGNWSSTVTLKQDHALIRSGPYRWTRHPIYTWLLLAIAGTALDEGNWRSLLALALATFAFCRKLRIEERFLLAQFGDAYRGYRGQVPALLPWPRR